MRKNDINEVSPNGFEDAVHQYLYDNQKRYGKKYEDYFIYPPIKQSTLFSRSDGNITRTFSSVCCIAGKMCGLFFHSNDTLPVLLEAVKKTYQACQTEAEKKQLALFFGNKTAEDLTNDDLLEIGLYGKLDNQPRSPSQLLLRHQNLKTIYASEHQRWNRQGNSLPEHINHCYLAAKPIEDGTAHIFSTKPDAEIPNSAKKTFVKEPDPLSSSELYTHKYTVKSTKSNDPGKLWKITQSNKTKLSDENCFQKQLRDTLRRYFDERRDSLFFIFARQSKESKKLYSDLYDALTEEDVSGSQKTANIIERLNAEKKEMEKKPKKRRLITMLTEAGFMTPDILNYKTPSIQSNHVTQPFE